MSKKFEVKMDASGRVCIPKDVRKQLGLKPGVKIAIESRCQRRYCRLASVPRKAQTGE